MPPDALVRIVDAALAQAVSVSGARLACRPGCCECCMGPFPISDLDAQRLRRGLAELEAADPPRAGQVRERARAATGADDEPCPALDPSTGLCDLYAARPITCRVFGPPMRTNGGPVGLCELCFVGASDEEIAACATEIPELPDLDAPEETTVAQALA
jgi:Fe-S-cluster containining protein